MEPLKVPLVRPPVLVVGENGSDYASMGSGEFDSDGIERESDDIGKDCVKRVFKSAFAQELNDNTGQSFMSEYSHRSLPKSQFDEILDKTLDFRKAQEDYLKVKQENARLRFEIEKQKFEEERYRKLQLEIEHLTCKLSKVRSKYYKICIFSVKFILKASYISILKDSSSNKDALWLT